MLSFNAFISLQVQSRGYEVEEYTLRYEQSKAKAKKC